jgi:hypothetical protein
MLSKRDNLQGLLFSASLLLLINIPLLIAYQNTDQNQVFAGLLLNPIDGQSYLAKMRQGFEGAWTFVLPYTTQPGDPAPINLYYILLGHLSRIANISIISMFHIARLAGSFLLFQNIWMLSRKVFSTIRFQYVSFLLASLGTGLGWIALFWGALTPDFWLSEAYPFLAVQANAHFPLGIALQIIILFSPALESNSKGSIIRIILFGTALALIYPFGFALTGFVLAGQALFKLINRQEWRLARDRLLAFGILGAPILFAQWLIVRNHSVLSIWNTQNLTPLPNFAELLIAFLPVVVASSIYLLNKNNKYNKEETVLGLWIVAALVLALIPSNLQRRFLSGLYIPLVILGVRGLEVISRKKGRELIAIFSLLMISFPTSLVVSLSSINAIQSHDRILFLQEDENAAISWLQQNAASSSLVAASPEIGLYLPARGNFRVIYGHPFESIDSDTKKLALEAFFSDSKDPWNFLEINEANYVFYGPREREFGKLTLPQNWTVVYEIGEVQIFSRVGN